MTSATQASPFDQLQAALERGGAESLLDELVSQLRGQKKYHELFEALKMRLRHQLGLPILWQDSSELDEPTRDRLEDGLIDACREVGTSLLQEGKVREGWMYLRPVGENKAVAEILSHIEVDEDNLEDIVGVSLQEGVDVRRGYSLVLEHYGTCNAITTYEAEVARRGKDDQQTAAGLLVEHVHQELTASVKADIAQQQGAEPTEATLAELVAERPWLFSEYSYHIDTTHLASTVRFARVLDEPRRIRLALDLTEYGRRLSAQFQYQGEEPFVDIYPSHALYFSALLGEQVDEALRYFHDKAESLDAHQVGTGPIEIYVDLLARVGRPEEAIEASVSLLAPDMQTWGLAPSLFELCEQAKSYDRMLEQSRQREDLLGFAAAMMQSNRS